MFDHRAKIHTREEPYKCSDCDEAFTTAKDRSRHFKKVHGSEGSHVSEKSAIKETKVVSSNLIHGIHLYLYMQ